MAVVIRIPGVPIPKARARVTRAGHTYTPGKTVQHERLIALIARTKTQPIEGPLGMRLTFFMPIPVSWPKAKKEAAIRGDVLPTTKPDIDNLAKCVLDALNGIAYRDDNQVVRLESSKFYGDPATLISIEPLSAEATS